MRPQELELHGGSRQQIFAGPTGGRPRTGQKLPAVALPQVARAEPRKDVARILNDVTIRPLSLGRTPETGFGG